VPQDSGIFWFRVGIAVIAAIALAMLIGLIALWQTPRAVPVETPGATTVTTTGSTDGTNACPPAPACPEPVREEAKPPPPQDGYGVQVAAAQPTPAAMVQGAPAPVSAASSPAVPARIATAVTAPKPQALVCVVEYRSGAMLHRRVTARLPGARCYRLGT
jgi:hypothetical protein